MDRRWPPGIQPFFMYTWWNADIDDLPSWNRRETAMRYVVVAIALVCAFGVVAQTHAQTSPKVALPAAVEAAFKKAYPNATIKNVSKETDAGRTVYEIESIDSGRRRDLNYFADGSLILYEEELTEADIPPAVTTALKTRYPKATITTRERLYTVKDNSANYEFGLKGVPGVAEAILTPTGAWVSPKMK